MNKCIKCLIEKPKTDFTFRRDRANTKNAYTTVCKKCIAERARIKRNGTSEYKPRPATKEWLKPDNRYIGFLYKLKKLEITRCHYCRKEINKEYSPYTCPKPHKKNFYCDEWCKESDNPPRIVKCKGCGIAVNYKRFSNKSGRWYNRYCEQPCCAHFKEGRKLSTVKTNLDK